MFPLVGLSKRNAWWSSTSHGIIGIDCIVKGPTGALQFQNQSECKVQRKLHYVATFRHGVTCLPQALSNTLIALQMLRKC